jgi:hypothetical protein
MVFAAMAAIGLGCARDRPPPRFRSKRTIVRLEPTPRVERLVTSDDGARYAWIRGTPDGGCAVTASGITHPTYRECGGRMFTFMRGPGPLVYDARDASGDGWLVVDGVALAMADVDAGSLVGSRSGRRWAIVAQPAKDTPDGALVIDGAPVGRWPEVVAPTLSDDDAHAAAIVRTDDGALALVVDGQERQRYGPGSPPCGDLPAAPPGLSTHVQLRYASDGRLFQVVPDVDGWTVKRDDERVASYTAHVPATQSGATASPACDDQTAVLVGSLVTAERAPVAAWWERVAGDADDRDLRWRVRRDDGVVDDQTCRWPSYGSPISISPDGRHVGYVCSVGDAGPTAEVYVVLDGRRFGPYRQAWGLEVAPDGAHVTYAGAAGGGAAPWRVYRDGTPLSHSFWSIWPPRFTPDGRHVAWEAQDDRDGRGAVGVDGTQVARFDGILSGPLFPAPDRVAWVILRGRRVVRLDLGLR